MAGNGTIENILMEMKGPSTLDLACADVLQQAVVMVLADLGIKDGDTEDVQAQMEADGICITEQDWTLEHSALNGLYIYQKLKPMAFISMPFLERATGKVSVKLVRFYKSERVDNLTGEKVV